MKPSKEKLFVFDCEWTPLKATYFDMKLDLPLLADVFEHQVDKWEHQRKMDGLDKFGTIEDWWEEKAHFYPEFCKIICVSYGYFAKGEFVIKSLWGEDEKQLLASVQSVFDKVNQSGYVLSGYSIKRFDMPWLAKRMMTNGVAPPPNLSVYGKKPWEVDVFDVQEAWGQGNMQESYTPLEIACTAMGIPSPKDDLVGSKVKEAYWNGEILRIKEYCEKDVRQTKELAVKLIELLP
jgi:predicted PolB exonuclease-like 3'-5' exonuclease